MSKLIDNLRRLLRTSPSPIGFGRASLPQPAPMLLLGHLPQVNDEILDLVSNSGLDGVIVGKEAQNADAQVLARLAKAVGPMPLGVFWTGATDKDSTSLVEAGADFVVADAATAPAAILHENRLGHLLAIDTDMPDNLVRAIDALPAEAVLLRTGFETASFLTINNLLACQRVASLLRKPLIATVSPVLNTTDLQALVGVGIKGIAVKLADKETFTQLAELKHTLEKLSAPKSQANEVIIPQLNPAPSQPEEDDDDDGLP